MKNMRKVVATILVVMMVSSVALTGGCSSKTNETEKTEASEAIDETSTENEDESAATSVDIDASTIGGRICSEFFAAVADGNNRVQIAERLSADDVTGGYACMTMDVEEGYLNGFDDQITGFRSGTMVAPVIGSVPFVVYIFESDDPEALKDELMAHADPRWNICTEADETICQIYGDYVFFSMTPLE